MNRQAKYIGVGHWHNYGPVSHADAAMQHARDAWPDGWYSVLEFETRDEPTPEQPDPPVFRHRVERTVQYKVTPLRGDNKPKSEGYLDVDWKYRD